jgi:DNA-binding LacI/PurR family transcriptional regulator
VIAGSSPADLGHFSELMKRGLSLVAFDLVTTATGMVPPVDSVSMDNRRAGYLATRHLVELGHRRIGYISGATPTMSRRDRLDGYRQALNEAGIGSDPTLIAAGVDSARGDDDTHGAERGRMAALELLKLADAPTALVALNDMHALGACAAVRDKGGSIPEDVSVVGIDDITLASLLAPPLTTIRQPIEKLSEAAVEILTQRIAGNDPSGPQHVVFDPHLVVRSSTAPCKRKGAMRVAKRKAGDRSSRE